MYGRSYYSSYHAIQEIYINLTWRPVVKPRLYNYEMLPNSFKITRERRRQWGRWWWWSTLLIDQGRMNLYLQHLQEAVCARLQSHP